MKHKVEYYHLGNHVYVDFYSENLKFKISQSKLHDCFFYGLGKKIRQDYCEGVTIYFLTEKQKDKLKSLITNKTE